ncbi:MAG: histidinol-phosphate aminotransferase [Flavipsychrobacter sp.]|jgi:histidinol-phosphate aminotransferase|nr:histidinol-phosphate aminotransferase [Flavipsychrobacter sp.]
MTSDFEYLLNNTKIIDQSGISLSLSNFIRSGLVDYAYLEDQSFPIDLSIGINPIGCPKSVRKYLKTREIDLTSYSEVTAINLRNKIAKFNGLNDGEVHVGPGISDLLHVTLLTFIDPGDEVLLPEISFPAYEILALLVRGVPKFIPFSKKMDMDYSQVAKSISPKTKVVVLCNPNNPTGKAMDVKKITKVIKDHPSVVFMIDEANIDFGGESLMKYAGKLPNLLILRSFSKGFGLAGLRIGYVAGPQEKVLAIERRQTPFSTTVISQKLAELVIGDKEFLEKSKAYCDKQRKYLERELTKMGYTFIPSDSNYLLVNVADKFPDSKTFINAINQFGANALDGGVFRSLNNDFVRISPRSHKLNKEFIKIVKSLTKK